MISLEIGKKDGSVTTKNKTFKVLTVLDHTLIVDVKILM
jgi:hypothetical protein